MSIPTSFHLEPSPLYGTYYHYSVFTTKQVLARGAMGHPKYRCCPSCTGVPASPTLRPCCLTFTPSVNFDSQGHRKTFVVRVQDFSMAKSRTEYGLDWVKVLHPTRHKV